MPFINSKISTALSEEQEKTLVSRLGQAVTLIPGKSESWLMTGFEPAYHLYFRGENSTPAAFVEVKLFGSENKSAFAALTAEICNIYQEVLGIPSDHIYIKYQAVANWGSNGSNL